MENSRASGLTDGKFLRILVVCDSSVSLITRGAVEVWTPTPNCLGRSHQNPGRCILTDGGTAHPHADGQAHGGNPLGYRIHRATPRSLGTQPLCYGTGHAMHPYTNSQSLPYYRNTKWFGVRAAHWGTMPLINASLGYILVARYVCHSPQYTALTLPHHTTHLHVTAHTSVHHQAK
jgi:hypothetical protein